MSTVPRMGESIVDGEGRQRQLLNEFLLDLNDLFMLSGSGTPEATVKASAKRLYMDTSGTAGSILYIKRDDSLTNDPKKGWVLV